MKVIAILFHDDTEIDGVEAVVAIPKGKTAKQTFATWLKSQEKDDRDSFTYEEFTVETPPANRKTNSTHILGMPIEGR